MCPTCPLSENDLLDNIPKSADAGMNIIEGEDVY